MKATEMLKLCEYLATFETENAHAPNITAVADTLFINDYTDRLDFRIMGGLGFEYDFHLCGYKYVGNEED